MAARFDPGVRIEAALKKVPSDQWIGLADYVFPISKSSAITEGHKETALAKALGQNVYSLDMRRAPLSGGQRMGVCICFFGESEQEILDRLGVAVVMLT
jgi:hypothetical protein